MNEKTCFNCVHSKVKNDKYYGINNPIADCENKNVDIELFNFWNEKDLPEYCGNHELKQEKST